MHRRMLANKEGMGEGQALARVVYIMFIRDMGVQSDTVKARLLPSELAGSEEYI